MLIKYISMCISMVCKGLVAVTSKWRKVRYKYRLIRVCLFMYCRWVGGGLGRAYENIGYSTWLYSQGGGGMFVNI
jgi:hypothetical protein